MAQKPVADALTLELEPVVEANMTRHLDTEDIWFAHDYVPFDQGRTSHSSADAIGIHPSRRCPERSPTHARSC